MHILVCDDDAVFAAQMDEYISEWFRAREIQVQSTCLLYTSDAADD